MSQYSSHKVLDNESYLGNIIFKDEAASTR